MLAYVIFLLYLCTIFHLQTIKLTNKKWQKRKNSSLNQTNNCKK